MTNPDEKKTIDQNSDNLKKTKRMKMKKVGRTIIIQPSSSNIQASKKQSPKNQPAVGSKRDHTQAFPDKKERKVKRKS